MAFGPILEAQSHVLGHQERTQSGPRRTATPFLLIFEKGLNTHIFEEVETSTKHPFFAPKRATACIEPQTLGARDPLGGLLKLLIIVIN